MKLVIVESPAKAKTIEKYLGKDYTVRASVGHIRDLPKSNKNAIDIEGGFVPHYEIVKGKEKVLSELTPLVKKADEVILATDPDREGEAIAWHVAQALHLNEKKTKRVVFHEITKDAVLEAMSHPRTIDTDLRRAQEARRVLDRLVGYDLSGLIWKKVRYGLSAGRVQSPAMRIIMEREREIRAFVSEDFFVITANVLTEKKDALTLTCTEEPRKKEEADRIVDEGEKGSWNVKDIKEQEQKRSARPPFTTSTLQQAASTRLGFSPSRTMMTAQRLYEAGHITYMRTDSTTLSAQAIGTIAGVIEKKFGKNYVDTKQYKTKSKNAQEAHEAVRPSDVKKEVAGTTDEQKKLYKLIWTRTVASQMADAKVLKTKITTEVADPASGGADGIVPDFAINGSRVMFDGWLKADPAARGEDVELPKVTVGEKFALKEMHVEEKQTQPPSRYTEAGLIKELEKRGIGRPSTYASIMKTINDRGYVTKEGKTLFPTDTGDVVSTFLENNFANYISDSFTADMEDKLDDVAAGSRKYEATLRDFYGGFSKDVKSKEKIEKLTNLGEAPEGMLCPTCQSDMVIKLSRAGKFLSCSRFPDCTGARMIDGKVLEPNKPIGTHPETGEPIFVLDGRFGPYVQVGEKSKENPKPKRASIPKDKDVSTVTIEDALRYLSLPRILGTHPQTGKDIIANNGRFGPYVMHDGDFRSLKTDSVYDVSLERALAILAEEKKTRRFAKKASASGE